MISDYLNHKRGYGVQRQILHKVRF